MLTQAIVKNSEQDITQSSEILQVRLNHAALGFQVTFLMAAARAQTWSPACCRGSWLPQLMQTANGSCRSAKSLSQP